jgi:hypothetical protein
MISTFFLLRPGAVLPTLSSQNNPDDILELDGIIGMSL